MRTRALPHAHNVFASGDTVSQLYGRFVDPAWVAVIGTVSDVAVTATSSMLTSMLTGRHQHTIAERQLADADSERTRRRCASPSSSTWVPTARFETGLVLHHQQRTGERDTPDGWVSCPC